MSSEKVIRKSTRWWHHQYHHDGWVYQLSQSAYQMMTPSTSSWWLSSSIFVIKSYDEGINIIVPVDLAFIDIAEQSFVLVNQTCDEPINHSDMRRANQSSNHRMKGKVSRLHKRHQWTSSKPFQSFNWFLTSLTTDECRRKRRQSFIPNRLLASQMTAAGTGIDQSPN